MTRESGIIYERGDFWIYAGAAACEVMRPYGAVASQTDCAFPRTPDGLSLAKARVDYLAKRAAASMLSAKAF